MDLSVRSIDFSRVSDKDHVVISGQRLIDADFSGRRLKSFSAEGSQFDGCRFDDAVIESASLGAGRRVTEYIGCSFSSAKLRMASGRFTRFVDCAFDDSVIENWFCFAVEIVGCTFSGRLKKLVFNGSVPLDMQAFTGRKVNQFEDNDFSRAKLVDVGFRTGIDLTRQRLPDSDDYTYLADAASTVRRA